MKQVIVVRTDLKMGKGKIAAQCAHASIGAFLRARSAARRAWLASGMKKIVVKVGSEAELVRIYRRARRARLPCIIINDAGLTQLEPGVATAVGIGPARDARIDKITAKLKLL